MNSRPDSSFRRLWLSLSLLLILPGIPALPVRAIALQAAVQTPAQGQPNVVLIVADDMGWGDLGVQGAGGFQTPHLDRLAAEGTRFTSFCVAQAVCTASRAALMTGCYPNRLGLQGAYNHTSRDGVAATEWLLPEMFRDCGYAVGGFGKWHLGTRPAFHPLRHGFHEWLGIPYSNDNSKYHPVLAGRVSDVPFMGIDWLPTLTELAGGKPSELPIDGRSIAGLLLGRPDAAAPHEFLYFYSGTALQAVRSGPWKLHFPHPFITPAGAPGKDGKPSGFGTSAPASIQQSGVEGIATRHGYRIEMLEESLFHLDRDPGERINVAQQHPEIVQRLSIAGDGARQELGDSLRAVAGLGLRAPGLDPP